MKELLLALLTAVTPPCTTEDDPTFCNWQSNGRGYDFVNVPLPFYWPHGATVYGAWHGTDQPKGSVPLIVLW